MSERAGPQRVVAIDGPSGSGKSTVARGVGAGLGLDVLDTGAMYRSVTLAALETGADLSDGEALAGLARRTTIEPDDDRVRLDGRDVTSEIRGPAVTAAVSTVSAHPAVRGVLVARQRAWVNGHRGGVVEGRDIGTVVFPTAAVKVYLTAGPEERARRRLGDETAAARPAALGDVVDQMSRRDTLDSLRDTSPLAVAPDAVVIDTTARTVGEIVDDIVTRARRAFARVETP